MEEVKYFGSARFYYPTVSLATVIETNKYVRRDYLRNFLEQYCRDEFEENRSLKKPKYKKDPSYNSIRSLEEPVYMGPYELDYNYLVDMGIAFNNNFACKAVDENYSMIQSMYSLRKKHRRVDDRWGLADKILWGEVLRFYSPGAVSPLSLQNGKVVESLRENLQNEGIDSSVCKIRVIVTGGTNQSKIFSDLLGQSSGVYTKPCEEEWYCINGFDRFEELIKAQSQQPTLSTGRGIDFQAAYLKFPDNLWIGLVPCPKNSLMRQKSEPLKATLVAQDKCSF